MTVAVKKGAVMADKKGPAAWLCNAQEWAQRGPELMRFA